MSGFDVDLFVIGGGSGGVRAARIAASHGAKVMVAEEFRVGGTCVIRGCVPKKLMAYASRFADDFADAAGFGWDVAPPNFDWRKFVAAKEREITRLSGLYRANLANAGAELAECRASVLSPHEVRLARDGQVIRAKHILIATGAAPALEPAVPGLQHAISSNEIFDLPEFPKRLLIVGGGYIAVEFASVFARLGADVTLSLRADNVLRGFDEDMREGLRDALTHAGISIRAGALPTAIARTADGLEAAMSDGAAVQADQVLIATGRRPNTQNLGLEAAGVALDRHGAVVVDGYSATSVPSIFAVGDVTNRLNLTPVAIREGHAFADTVFGGKDICVDHENVATAVFTTPEIGTVGLTEAAAREKHGAIDVYLAKFRPMKATLSGREEKTVMKIVVDGASGRVLGVHILGHEAGEMAQVLGIAVKMGATKADFDATMAVHPTAAEELVTMRKKTR